MYLQKIDREERRKKSKESQMRFVEDLSLDRNCGAKQYKIAKENEHI
jgi:hypothetical protein